MKAKIATKFLKDEAQVKTEWLEHLLDDDNVPLDVAYKATCKIQREYHPYAIFDVTCSGSWSATSIWEHEEEYQVARDVTVYIDHWGKEHKQSGYDYHGGNKYYRRPMSKTVYDTKTRTITDNVEFTKGSVSPKVFTEQIATSDLPQILSWAGNFSKDEFIEVDEAYLSNYKVIPETVQPGGAEGQAKNAAINDLSRVAQRDVPGDRFEDFGIDANIHEVKRCDAYLAVYHVFYEYEGEQFEGYISGGTNVSDFAMDIKPVDDSVKEHLDNLGEAVKENGFFSGKTFFLVVAVVGWLFVLLSFITPGLTDRDYIYTLVDLVIAIFCSFKYYHMRKVYNTASQMEEQFKTDNTFLKQQIRELSQNESISDEEKAQMIEVWLTEHSKNTSEAAGLLKTQQGEADRQIENQKKKITGLFSRDKN